MGAGLLQPGGLPAISRGLSEATPPEYTRYRASTPEGSQQSAAAKKIRHSPKAMRMVLSGKWHPAPDKKDCDPFGVLLSRPTAKSRNELSITMSAERGNDRIILFIVIMKSLDMISTFTPLIF